MTLSLGIFYLVAAFTVWAAAVVVLAGVVLLLLLRKRKGRIQQPG